MPKTEASAQTAGDIVFRDKAWYSKMLLASRLRWWRRLPAASNRALSHEATLATSLQNLPPATIL